MSAYWSLRRVEETLGASAQPAPGGAAPELPRAFSSVSTDTRAIEPGALFVAIRGERFDAHDFLANAAVAGAAGAVVDRRFWGDAGPLPDDLAYLVVEDTLAALGRLGNRRRRDLATPVCAITGTNGKTTTKEMLRAVLATRFRVHATSGNLNNLVGTPLTLLAAPDDAEVMVVEVGTNAPGEIARLGEITEPDVVVITVVAEGHLEGLASLEGVLAEKTSLIAALREGGSAVVGDEPPSLPERARALHGEARVAGWSELSDADLRAEAIEVDADGLPRFRWRGRDVRLSYPGKHNVRNSLLALGAADCLGVDIDAGVEALASVSPSGMRSEVRRLGSLRVVADCYNANPASLDAAVDLLTSLPRRGGRVAVVGSMLELGGASEDLHRSSAERLAASDVDLIVATGEFVSAFGPLRAGLGERLIVAADPMEAAEPLRRRLRGAEVVLLKGSRGVALERLIPVLEEIGGEPPAPDRAANHEPAREA